MRDNALFWFAPLEIEIGALTTHDWAATMPTRARCSARRVRALSRHVLPAFLEDERSALAVADVLRATDESGAAADYPASLSARAPHAAAARARAARALERDDGARRCRPLLTAMHDAYTGARLVAPRDAAALWARMAADALAETRGVGTAVVVDAPDGRVVAGATPRAWEAKVGAELREAAAATSRERAPAARRRARRPAAAARAARLRRGGHALLRVLFALDRAKGGGGWKADLSAIAVARVAPRTLDGSPPPPGDGGDALLATAEAVERDARARRSDAAAAAAAEAAAAARARAATAAAPRAPRARAACCDRRRTGRRDGDGARGALGRLAAAGAARRPPPSDASKSAAVQRMRSTLGSADDVPARARRGTRAARTASRARADRSRRATTRRPTCARC